MCGETNGQTDDHDIMTGLHLVIAVAANLAERSFLVEDAEHLRLCWEVDRTGTFTPLSPIACDRTSD